MEENKRFLNRPFATAKRQNGLQTLEVNDGQQRREPSAGTIP
jgi:hypothetical protein